MPVEVTASLPPVEPAQECSEGSGVIKMSLANGHHMDISVNFDSEAFARLARSLSEAKRLKSVANKAADFPQYLNENAGSAKLQKE